MPASLRVARGLALALLLGLPVVAHGTRVPRAPGVGFAPAREGARGAPVVFLHGLCCRASNCTWLREGLPEERWLVCPRAPVACPGGASRWSSSPAAHLAVVQRSLAEFAALDPAHLDASSPGVLFGFSEGAWALRGMLPLLRGRARALVFVGANLELTAAQLRASGARRFVFASGRRDGAYRYLREAARVAQRAGLEARFFDLGRVGHTFVPEAGSSAWREVLAWAQGEDAAPSP